MLLTSLIVSSPLSIGISLHLTSFDGTSNAAQYVMDPYSKTSQAARFLGLSVAEVPVALEGNILVTYSLDTPCSPIRYPLFFY